MSRRTPWSRRHRHLTEELGIPPDLVTRPRPLRAVEHPANHVSDLGLALATRLTGAQVLDAYRGHANLECDSPHAVPFAASADFGGHAGDLPVPPARVFLARPGLLPGADRRCRPATPNPWRRSAMPTHNRPRG